MSRPQTDKTARALDEALRKVSAQGVIYSHLVARRLGINSTDLECLDFIIMRQPITAGELALATGLTTGAVTGVIDRLEKAGFARRERDAVDRRKVLVRAQPAVERAIAPLFEPMQRAMQAALAGYSEKERALLVEFFARTSEAARIATAALQKKTSGVSGKRKRR